MPTHHRIDYVELPARDLRSVEQVYGELFDWTFTSYGPDYLAFDDGSLDGGLFRADSTSDSAGTGAALIVLYSSDLEETQRAIEVAGGQVIRPIFSFPGGRRFHFRDPVGNELAVWSDK